MCLFVNDVCDAQTLERLASGGTRLVALRCAGFNNVDLAAAARLGIPVVRVPAYSPHAVAEFTVGLILTLNRQIHRAYNRTRDNNFALDGLLGFDLSRQDRRRGRHRQDRRPGRAPLKLGFGCEVLAHDPWRPDPALTPSAHPYLPLEELAAALRHDHPPLPANARYQASGDPGRIARMKPGVMLVQHQPRRPGRRRKQ